jgi:hypothetical protein
MMKISRLAQPALLIALLAGFSLTQAETPTPPASEALSSLPTADEPDCATRLKNAEGQLEQGVQFNARKQWRDGINSLRDAAAALMSTATHCPDLAAQANALSEKAHHETKQAESNVSFQSDCQPRLDKALDLDIQASSARREKKEPREIELLLAEAEAGWRDAVSLCQSPHREKAERNLNATLRARATNAEQLSGGPACDSAWKNANTLGELAKSAWKDKQWEEAAMLYHKGLLAWEGASEKCLGSRQQLAIKKIEQTQTDAHNAEYCGPQWDEATELTQHMKANAASATVLDRETQSIKAEVAWRDAVNICRGTPQALAKGNADALARERGAPLPPQAMAQYGKKTVLTATIAPGPSIAPAQTVTHPVPDNASARIPEKPKAVAPVAPVASVSPVASRDTTEVTAPPPPPVKAGEPEVIVSGNTTYRGNFTRHAETGALSGLGTVEWSNGERYNGYLLDGARHGKGRFTWTNGQWYDGEWKNNIALGQGVIHFSNGNRYEGLVSNGLPHGQGTLNFASGDRYTGNFMQGTFHGQGSYFWKSGSRYDGEWLAGSKHGKGRLTMENGNGWEGEFRDDKETDAGKRFTATSKPGDA